MSEIREDVLAEIERLRRRIGELQRAIAGQALEGVLSGEALDVVIVRVEPDRYAVPLTAVERVEMMCALVSFPESTPSVPGLLNLRGELIPVIDAQARLGQRSRPAHPDDFIVVCRSDTLRLGLIVQEVHGLRRLDGRVRAVPPELPQAPYVVGLVEGDDAPAFLFSLPALAAASHLPEGARE